MLIKDPILSLITSMACLIIRSSQSAVAILPIIVGLIRNENKSIKVTYEKKKKSKDRNVIGFLQKLKSGGMQFRHAEKIKVVSVVVRMRGHASAFQEI